MKTNFFQKIILCAFLYGIMFLSCVNQGGGRIEDIIPLQRLTAGSADTVMVSDLFFAPEYRVKFEKHPHVEVKYFQDTGELIFSPDSNYEGLTLIRGVFNKKRFVIPLRVQMIPAHTFIYRPPDSPGQVNVFGSFNSWNRLSVPMAFSEDKGEWSVTLQIEPGRYEYRFYTDGQEFTDTANPEKVPNPFGEFNSLLVIPPRDTGEIMVYPLSWKNIKSNIELSLLISARPEPDDLLKEDLILLLDNAELSRNSYELVKDTIKIMLTPQQLRHGPVLRAAVCAAGRYSLFYEIMFHDGTPVSGDNQSFLWNDAIIYSIIIDRFADGNPGNTRKIQHPELADKANYYGGDLQGIIDKLEDGYFEALGVNTIWLSPVNQNPEIPYREFPEPHRYFTGYHGYWPVHHERVDDRFGAGIRGETYGFTRDRASLRVFRKLVDAAHDREIRVLLDFVSNHVHQDHPFYQNNPEWFGVLNLPDGRKNIRFWDEYRLTTWFDTFLPSFDYEKSDEALEVMTDNAVWWMKETGIDGFRQDAVKHVPNRFWRTLTRKIKKEIDIPQNRKSYQIGETFGGYDLISSYVNNGQLDAQFNFQIYDAGLYTFLTPDASFKIIDDEMKKTFQVYGQHHLMGNLMDSHDKVRYPAHAEGDVPPGSPDAVEIGWNNPPEVEDPLTYEKTKLYLAFILTIPGVPVIYYGNEIGLTGAQDPDNRRPMRFRPDLNGLEEKMFDDVTDIIQLRRMHTALRYGTFTTVQADENIYAYIRSDLNENLLIILNKSGRNQSARIDLPGHYADFSRAEKLAGNAQISAAYPFIFNLPAYGYACYQLKR